MEYQEALAAVADGRARAVRLAVGLTLPAAGREVGVTGPTVWRWEHGLRHPHPAMAKAYVDRLVALLEEA